MTPKDFQLADKPFYQDEGIRLFCGDALSVLRQMPDESVQCAITSPPYYGLRSYGTEPIIWANHNGCKHEWGQQIKNPKLDTRPIELKIAQGGQVGSNVATQHWAQGNLGNFCQLCDAWRGELGLEPTFQLYISHLIEIFREVKRVLKKDGTCFVNLGDSFSGDLPVRVATAEVFSQSWDKSQTRTNGGNRRSQVNSVPRKSLMNIPGRFAIAMTDGLDMIQRNEIIWFKRACMPSSAKDRFTVDFEPIYFFAKNPKYKFNQQIEPLAESTANDYRMAEGLFTDERPERNFPANASKGSGMLKPCKRPDRPDSYGPGDQADRAGGFYPYEAGRNKRCVWDVPFEPQAEDHYASYPTKLIEPMVLAGTDEGDTVLDIFAGTGTTLLTALRYRRKATGIELQPKYIAIAQKRLRDVQVKLF